MADKTPVHEKDSNKALNNCRPVSVLSNISKVYERIMFKQMPEYCRAFFLNINVHLGMVLVRSTV